MRRLILAFAMLAVAAGCDRCELRNVQGIPDAVDQIDVFNQKQAARVDVLWMVDNSPTMASEQKKVADRFNVFFHQLIVSAVDYHIGVLALDTQNKGILQQYTGPVVAGCNACRFVSKDIACDNPDVDLTGLTSETDIDNKLITECPAQLVFRNLVQTGSNGPPFEQEFKQVAASLGLLNVDPATGIAKHDPPQENAGFIRDDAALFIVFVSDEDEDAKNAASPVRYWQRLFEGLKGAGNENKVTTAAIVGYADGSPGEGPASPVPIDKACDVLRTTFDADPSNDDPQAQALIQQLANPSDGCVDKSAPPGDSAASSETGSRQLELACRTGGLVANLCDADYGDALTNLGANAAGLLRKFDLSIALNQIDFGPDCTPFTDDDRILDCDGNGNTNDAIDGPICVTALGIAPPETKATPHLVSRKHLGADGKPDGGLDNWSYNASTNSLRFDNGFVPAPNTQVQVRYFKAAKPQTCTPSGG